MKNFFFSFISGEFVDIIILISATDFEIFLKYKRFSSCGKGILSINLTRVEAFCLCLPKRYSLSKQIIYHCERILRISSISSTLNSEEQSSGFVLKLNVHFLRKTSQIIDLIYIHPNMNAFLNNATQTRDLRNK